MPEDMSDIYSGTAFRAEINERELWVIPKEHATGLRGVSIALCAVVLTTWNQCESLQLRWRDIVTLGVEHWVCGKRRSASKSRGVGAGMW
jgi:hypothetical protein